MFLFVWFLISIQYKSKRLKPSGPIFFVESEITSRNSYWRSKYSVAWRCTCGGGGGSKAGKQENTSGFLNNTLVCTFNIIPMLRLLICDANLDVRDSVRDLVLPLTSDLLPGGILVITLKLGRRVGEDGILRKVEAVKRLLITAGIEEVSIRTVWLFSNSKNERTVLARKPFL